MGLFIYSFILLVCFYNFVKKLITCVSNLILDGKQGVSRVSYFFSYLGHLVSDLLRHLFLDITHVFVFPKDWKRNVKFICQNYYYLPQRSEELG